VRTLSHSPNLPVEGGNDLQNVVDPEFLFGCLNDFPFYPEAVSSSLELRMPPGSAEGETGNEEEARASKKGFKTVHEMYAFLTEAKVCTDAILLQLESGYQRV
jgi:hypothetical protein